MNKILALTILIVAAITGVTITNIPYETFNASTYQLILVIWFLIGLLALMIIIKIYTDKNIKIKSYDFFPIFIYLIFLMIVVLAKSYLGKNEYSFYLYTDYYNNLLMIPEFLLLIFFLSTKNLNKKITN